MRSQERFIISAAIVITALGFVLLPWWGFILVAIFEGFVFSEKLKRALVRLAGLTAFLWVLLIAVEDAMTGFRLSARVAGMFSLPHWIFVYVLMSLLVLGLAGLGIYCGQLIRIIVRANLEVSKPAD